MVRRDILLIMNDNSYAGREYLSKLKLLDLSVDVAIIGKYPSRDIVEEQRCAGLWTPVSQRDAVQGHSVSYFDSLDSLEFIEFLNDRKYELGIQGGTGILKQKVLDEFQLGILNFHPGKLPEYRGCSAPEWQLYEGKQVFCTCHYIDAGIDTGSVLRIAELNTNKKSYFHFRASIYPEIANFLGEIIVSYCEGKLVHISAQPQDESRAIHRSYIGQKKIDYIISHIFNYQ